MLSNSKKLCKHQYLNGGALIIYGLPAYISHNWECKKITKDKIILILNETNNFKFVNIQKYQSFLIKLVCVYYKKLKTSSQKDS